MIRHPLKILRESIDNHGSAKWAVIHNIYEENKDYPAVRHIFMGETAEEAKHYYDSHRKTDSFLRSCDDSHHFKDFDCRVTHKLIQL